MLVLLLGQGYQMQLLRSVPDGTPDAEDGSVVVFDRDLDAGVTHKTTSSFAEHRSAALELRIALVVGQDRSRNVHDCGCPAGISVGSARL